MTVTISMDSVLAKMIILLGVNVIKLHLDIMTSLIPNLVNAMKKDLLALNVMKIVENVPAKKM